MLKFITLAASIFITLQTGAQDMKKIEQELGAKFQRIGYWRDNGPVGDNDSLGDANLTFQKALVKMAGTHPASLTYAFRNLQDSGLMIATSDDQRLRIYSWDTWEGGSLHNFSTVFQYKGTNGVRTSATDTSFNLESSGYGGFCTPIYTLHTAGNTYYLVINHYILSTSEEGQGVQSYCIKKDSLDGSVKIFKTKTGLHNGVSFDFNFFSVVNRPERPVQLITYDPVHQTVTIPVVSKDGTVTKGTIVYRWTGQYFEHP